MLRSRRTEELNRRAIAVLIGERAMIAERVRAGLARARGEGKPIGRPLAPTLEKRVRIGMDVMLSDYRHWLEYDPVALGI
jgi:hypothetical protein